MNFKTYQEEANKTAIYPKEFGLYYTVLGLTGEAGEVANKVKKILRDYGGALDEIKRQEILSELGDVLWYLAEIATELDASLDLVAQDNLNKLYARKNAGVIKGSGDNRGKREIEIMSTLGFEDAKASVALDKDKSMFTQYELTDLDSAFEK